jgi:hypothetical protein
MSQTADKRQRFELLLKQAELPQDLIHTYFQDGYIEQVIVGSSNNGRFASAKRPWFLYRLIGRSANRLPGRLSILRRLRLY